MTGKGGERPGTHADPGYLGAEAPEHRQERPAKGDREQKSDGPAAAPATTHSAYRAVSPTAP